LLGSVIELSVGVATPRLDAIHATVKLLGDARAKGRLVVAPT
jgi:hypothetical protein